MTYERRRLILGIACVGTCVLTALVALLYEAPSRLFPTRPDSMVIEASAIVRGLFILAGVMLPFDILGGLVLPRVHRKSRLSAGRFVAKLSTAVFIYSALTLILFLVYRRVGTSFGVAGVIIAFGVCLAALLVIQPFFLSLLGMSCKRLTSDSDSITHPSAGTAMIADTETQAFTGGVVGLPGFETIVVPGGWKSRLSENSLRAEIDRRRAVIRTGGHRRGVIVAAVFNLTIFGCALTLPGSSVTSIAGLATAFCYYLLLSFVGLLALPNFNRIAVLDVDRALAAEIGPEAAGRSISEVGPLIDGELARSAELESVFHPIPCVQTRLDELHRDRRRGLGAWNVSRLTLFLSWAFAGPLSRAVHCNIGIPELWAVPPAD